MIRLKMLQNYKVVKVRIVKVRIVKVRIKKTVMIVINLKIYNYKFLSIILYLLYLLYLLYHCIYTLHKTALNVKHA